ncbi:hypothetical protein N7492_002690 [Penicillium capsulatum]|uniref:A1 cistron-splicing factor n=1 Tax=Penicillium capsulatum TaxID=69766 RepID=A0A9W9IJ31_9EURO|nr:hypothetical protein N7492_002690 [Penicillium capsulatum]KAJ6122712.1 hypothetical protein N7512_005177 [Penicillium capsulatum]
MSSYQASPTVLLPQLPPKTFVGIDLITFTSTANFHGIKDLPRGWHFLYTGATETLSLRSGAWFYIGDADTPGEGQSSAITLKNNNNQGTEVLVWKWEPDTESLVSLDGDGPLDTQDMMRFKANLGAIWQSGRLFRYRSRVSPGLLTKQGSPGNEIILPEDDLESEESGREDWRALTDRISPHVLSRIVGTPEIDLDARPRWPVTSANTASCDSDDIPGLETRPNGGTSGAPRTEREFGFIPIDLKKTWREGAVGRERTEAAQDRSWALGDMIKKYSGSSTGDTASDEHNGEGHVLGELQFTFLMALTMMNFSCLQQWKRLLGVILTCRQAIRTKESFMCDAIRLILRQLKRCDDVEGGLFEIDGDEGGRFLRELLTKFRRSVDEVPGSPVKAEFDRLSKWTKAEYEWELQRETILRRGMIQLEDGEEVEMEIEDNDEDEETGEYAPMVVET